MALPLPGEGDPRYQTWVMLLNGYGYNWYRKDNQLRADDLLVRQQACHFVNEAARHLQEQEAAYARKFIPPPSREQPFPPPERRATQTRIRRMREDLQMLESRIRSLSVPPTDRIWHRHRDEVDLLAKLGEKDAQLIGLARELETDAAALGFDDWERAEDHPPLFTPLTLIEQVLAARAELLLNCFA